MIVDIAFIIAVSTFNNGLSSVMKIVQVMQLTVGHNYYNFCVVADARRVKAAERSLTEAAKNARRTSRSSKKKEEEENNNLEG